MRHGVYPVGYRFCYLEAVFQQVYSIVKSNSSPAMRTELDICLGIMGVIVKLKEISFRLVLKV